MLSTRLRCVAELLWFFCLLLIGTALWAMEVLAAMLGDDDQGPRPPRGRKSGRRGAGLFGWRWGRLAPAYAPVPADPVPPPEPGRSRR